MPSLFRRQDEQSAPSLNTELLDRERAAHVLREAVDRLGLELIVTGNGEAARIFGPPGAGLPFEFTTSLALVSDGLLVTELQLPVVIPPEQIDAALELCLWLTAGSRFAYTLRGRRPCIRFPFELLAVTADRAPHWIACLFELYLRRAAGCFLAFQGIAAGSTAAQSLVGLGRVSADAMWARPWTGIPRSGTSWEVRTRTISTAQDASPVPAGYTQAEYRATHAAIMHLAAAGLQGGIREACAGPILIHADGHVECYGCDDPAGHPHIVGTTVACGPGCRLGAGHLCERCEPWPA